MIAIINCNKDKSCIGRLVGAISLINQATLVINEEILGRMEQEEIPINDCKCAIISGSAKLAAKGDTNKELEDFIKTGKSRYLEYAMVIRLWRRYADASLGMERR
jgi:hypothetical protein